MLDLRISLRLLRKQPIVTITMLFALATGIGMATAGFTVLDSIFFGKLPFPNGDRFVLLDAYTEPEAQPTGLDPERFRLLSTGAATLEHVGAFRSSDVNLRMNSGEVVPVTGASITPGSLPVFPYRPLLGRTLNAEDGEDGAPAVVMLRESLWRRHFSADPQIVGRAATIAGVSRTVIGVMPDTFKFPNSPELWMPLDTVPPAALASARTFAVLAAGTEPRAAASEMSALSQQVATANPSAPHLRIVVVRFTDAVSRGLELLGFVLVSCLVLVLLVIAANIANLVLARTESRMKELAVRTALGATRQRLIVQVFTEVVIVSVLAAIVGFAASQATLRWLRGTMTDMPFWVDFSASPRTMLFVAMATLLTAFVGGIMPALKATGRDMADVLAAAGRNASTGFGPLGALMVALQVAISIALLNGALVMAKGVAGYMHRDLPIAGTEVLTARLWSEKTDSGAIVTAMARIPGVIAASAGTSLPGLSPLAQMTVVEVSPDAPTPPRAAPVVAVREGFFEALGAERHDGRLFSDADFRGGAPPVAIVNEPFVAKFFGGVNPIGRRVRVLSANVDGRQQPWREIIGVVPDLGLSAGDPSMAAGFYVPMVGEEVFHVLIRTRGDARRLAGSLRSTLDQLDPAIQVRDVVALQDVGREDRVVFAVIGAAIAAVGGIALLLSVIATYAILSLAVTRRTREIGIRTALGATRRQVLQSVMGRTVVPPAVGAAAGLLLAQALVAARGIFAFRLPGSIGPWGLPALAAVMIAAALFSAWVPARRALAIAPADALRSD